ncbi:MAG: insulinase family protein, partial [Chlamydiia bacterium]|nr:insulinase family protein [Chlamydiia bacterium]
DKMYLVIYSNQPLESLKQQVVKDFGPIEKRNVRDQLSDANLLSKDQEGHIFYIEPVRDVRDLTLTWELPTWATSDMGAKYPQLLSYVLGNGAKNSLEALLKKQGLAESVSSDMMRLSETKALFMLSVDLTTEGVEKREEVIQECFDAIGMLQKTGIPEYIYRDLQKMALINYEWQTRHSAFEYAQSIASQLPYEKLSTFPSKTLFYDSYNPKQIRKLLNTLTPENCFVSVVASPQLTDVQPESEEKWLGGKYAIRPFAINAIQPLPEIGLPKQNPFIPTNLQILPKKPAQNAPTQIANDLFGTSYYTPAPEFSVPEISWFISLKSPLIDGTPEHTALLDLFTRTASEKLTSQLFFASFAGLHAGVSQADLKLTLQINGYSDKAKILLDEMIQTFKNAKPTASEFAIYKESLLTTYANNQKAMPFMQANDLMASVIYNDSPSSKALYNALDKITYEDYLKFAGDISKQLYAETLFAGNLTKSQAEDIWAHLVTNLASTPYPLNEQHQKSVLVLSGDNGPFAISDSTSMQGNATLLLIEEGSFTYEKRAAQEILGTTLGEAFFKELRTKQQTGYIARGWKRDVADELLQFFAVQSASHGPDDLLSRFELFLETFIKDFSNEFSEEKFEEVKKGVITTLTNPPTNLVDLSSRLYTFAYVKHGDFNYLENIAQAAKALTYDQVRTYANEFFSRKNKRRLAVLLQGAPTAAAFHFTEITPAAVKNQGSFR